MRVIRWRERRIRERRVANEVYLGWREVGNQGRRVSERWVMREGVK